MGNERGHCATLGQNNATALTKEEAETYEPSVAKTSKLISACVEVRVNTPQSSPRVFEEAKCNKEEPKP
jgi:hypothetical protein